MKSWSKMYRLQKKHNNMKENKKKNFYKDIDERIA